MNCFYKLSAASKSENQQSHLNRHVTYSYENNGLNSNRNTQMTLYFMAMIQLNIKTVTRTIKHRIKMPFHLLTKCIMKPLPCTPLDVQGEGNHLWKQHTIMQLTSAYFDGTSALSTPKQILHGVAAAIWRTTWPTPEPRSTKISSFVISIWSIIWQTRS